MGNVNRQSNRGFFINVYFILSLHKVQMESYYFHSVNNRGHWLIYNFFDDHAGGCLLGQGKSTFDDCLFIVNDCRRVTIQFRWFSNSTEYRKEEERLR